MMTGSGNRTIIHPGCINTFYVFDEYQMSFHDVGFVGLIVDGSYFSVGYTDFNYNYLIHNWEHECHIIRRLFAVWGLMRIVMK
jgi:hypothetical protein